MNIADQHKKAAEIIERWQGRGDIDMLCPDSRFLVEQKSKNVDLDKHEERQGILVTPAEQAVRYSDNLPLTNCSHSVLLIC